MTLVDVSVSGVGGHEGVATREPDKARLGEEETCVLTCAYPVRELGNDRVAQIQTAIVLVLLLLIQAKASVLSLLKLLL